MVNTIFIFVCKNREKVITAEASPPLEKVAIYLRAACFCVIKYLSKLTFVTMRRASLNFVEYKREDLQRVNSHLSGAPRQSASQPGGSSSRCYAAKAIAVPTPHSRRGSMGAGNDLVPILRTRRQTPSLNTRYSASRRRRRRRRDAPTGRHAHSRNHDTRGGGGEGWRRGGGKL